MSAQHTQGPSSTVKDSLTAQYTPEFMASLEKDIEAAKRDVRKASEARAKLGPECSRAAITSANAKCARNAEYLERLYATKDRAKEAIAKVKVGAA